MLQRRWDFIQLFKLTRRNQLLALPLALVAKCMFLPTFRIAVACGKKISIFTSPQEVHIEVLGNEIALLAIYDGYTFIASSTGVVSVYSFGAGISVIYEPEEPTSPVSMYNTSKNLFYSTKTLLLKFSLVSGCWTSSVVVEPSQNITDSMLYNSPNDIETFCILSSNVCSVYSCADANMLFSVSLAPGITCLYSSHQGRLIACTNLQAWTVWFIECIKSTYKAAAPKFVDPEPKKKIDTTVTHNAAQMAKMV